MFTRRSNIWDVTSLSSSGSSGLSFTDMNLSNNSFRIDRSMFVDIRQEVLHQFMCGICLEIFVDPIVTTCCRQTYCNKCITQLLSTSSSCPNDRQPLTCTGLTQPSRDMINALNSMKIKCKYHTNGCQTTEIVWRMSEHLKTCFYNVCENCGSGWTSNEIHTSEVCIKTLKAKVESVVNENKRLEDENYGLFRENATISGENARMAYDCNC